MQPKYAGACLVPCSGVGPVDLGWTGAHCTYVGGHVYRAGRAGFTNELCVHLCAATGAGHMLAALL